MVRRLSRTTADRYNEGTDFKSSLSRIKQCVIIYKIFMRFYIKIRIKKHYLEFFTQSNIRKIRINFNYRREAMNKPYLNILIRVLPEKLLASIFISIFILNGTGTAIAKDTRPNEDLTPRGRNYVSNHFGESGLKDVNGVFIGVLGRSSATYTLLRHANRKLKNRVLITSVHQLCPKYLSQPSQLEIINTNVEPFQVVKAQSVYFYNQKTCTFPNRHCPSSPQEAPRQADIDHADVALVVLKEPLRESKDYCLTTHQSPKLFYIISHLLSLSPFIGLKVIVMPTPEGRSSGAIWVFITEPCPLFLAERI